MFSQGWFSSSVLSSRMDVLTVVSTSPSVASRWLQQLQGLTSFHGNFHEHLEWGLSTWVSPPYHEGSYILASASNVLGISSARTGSSGHLQPEEQLGKLVTVLPATRMEADIPRKIDLSMAGTWSAKSHF